MRYAVGIAWTWLMTGILLAATWTFGWKGWLLAVLCLALAVSREYTSDHSGEVGK